MSNAQTAPAPAPAPLASAGSNASGITNPQSTSNKVVRWILAIAYVLMTVGFCFLFWGVLWPDPGSRQDNLIAIFGIFWLLLAVACAVYLLITTPNDIPKLTWDRGAQVLGVLLTFVGFIFVPLVGGEKPDISGLAVVAAAAGLLLSAYGLYASLVPPSAQLTAARAATAAAEDRTADLKSKAEAYMALAEQAMRNAEGFVNHTSGSAVDVNDAIKRARDYQEAHWT